MRKPLLIIGLLAAIVYACNQAGKIKNPLLGTSKLRSQFFNIDITKDTTLITRHGAVIRIPHGALTTKGNTVQLEVKEAYSIQDIIKAGLTTQSNGQPLSSGGMIYINAVGENNVRITQKISIATPTSNLNKNMQLFKGEVQSDSTINWTNPTPLPQNPQSTALDNGKTLFENNCTSCHALGKDMTGPNLAHVIKRYNPYYGEGRDLSHPYNFIQNPAKAMEHSGYHLCLKKQFGGAMCMAFPKLTDEEIDNLYAYIENESERRKLPIPGTKLLQCYQECRQYQEIASKWKEIKTRLEKDSSYLLRDLRNSPSVAPDTTIYDEDTVLPWQPMPELDKVNPAMNRSLYYQFTIESFGWFNVDVLLITEGAVPSELMVRIQGQYKDRFSIYLVIPSIKLLAPGGPLKGQSDTYGFFTKDGAIPLPQQVKAYVLAMGEYEDKIIFAKKEFSTQQKQSFDLELTTVTKQVFQRELANLQSVDLKISVGDTKNAAQLKIAIKELKKAEALKPKNCDCDCFLIPVEEQYASDYDSFIEAQ